MATLVDNLTEQASAINVHFSGNMLYILLNDGREITLSLKKEKWLNWLLNATTTQRQNWQLEPGGFAVYWEDLDDGIEVSHLLE
ncbi:DUF2442 domain-containing protein [candidate division KSB1 bacterium]|nr:DUF2442 domain-containing protein [candidate division KSB1 bacterium]MBL7095335.1 DUF2442 domain-containing protein [candidate division KSB1 bacterium]